MSCLFLSQHTTNDTNRRTGQHLRAGFFHQPNRAAGRDHLAANNGPAGQRRKPYLGW